MDSGIITRNKQKSSKELCILVVFLLFVGSYQGVLPSILDEFGLILLVLFFVFMVFMQSGRVSIKRSIFTSFIMYFIVSLLTSIIRVRYDNNVLNMFCVCIFNNVKPVLFFILLISLRITDKERDCILKWFVLINIPSIILSIRQVLTRGMGNIYGLKVRNGMYRIEGYSGHPIRFSFILVSIILIILYYSVEEDWSRWGKIIVLSVSTFLFVLISYTRSRYPQLLVVALVFLFIFRKGKSIIRVAIIVLVAFAGLMIASFFLPFILEILSGEFNTVRFVGIRTGLQVLKSFPILGMGIGTFGSRISFELNSYVYDLFNVTYNTSRIANIDSGSFFEAGLFQKIVENGIVGTLLFYYPFLFSLKKSLRTDRFIVPALVFLFLMNSVLNSVYSIPLLFIVGVCVASMDN